MKFEIYVSKTLLVLSCCILMLGNKLSLITNFGFVTCDQHDRVINVKKESTYFFAAEEAASKTLRTSSYSLSSGPVGELI